MGRDLTKLLALLGEKWSLPVLAALESSPKRFSEIKATIPDVSKRMLAQTLRHLEAEKLIDRVVVESQKTVQYSVTKAGSDLFPELNGFRQWAEQAGDPAVVK